MRRILLMTLLISALPKLYGQSLSKPFEECEIDGSITIYDYHAKKWTSSDINDSHYPTLPASTFKIINTLIALEAGVVANENEIIKWPGTTDTIKYGYRPNIYHDMSMKEAFKPDFGRCRKDITKAILKQLDILE